MQGLLVEGLGWISAGVPLDINGAGMSGDWVHLHNARRAAIILQKGAWAGGTPAVTLEQSLDAAGTSGKALAFTFQYSGTSLTNDVLVKTAVVANTFNLSAVSNLYHIIEIHAQDLDAANNFDYFRCVVASPGANADLLAMMYIIGDRGWAGLPSTMPTAIAG